MKLPSRSATEEDPCRPAAPQACQQLRPDLGHVSVPTDANVSMRIPPEKSLSRPQASRSFASARDVVIGSSSPVASCRRPCAAAAEVKYVVDMVWHNVHIVATVCGACMRPGIHAPGVAGRLRSAAAVYRCHLPPASSPLLLAAADAGKRRSGMRGLQQWPQCHPGHDIYSWCNLDYSCMCMHLSTRRMLCSGRL